MRPRHPARFAVRHEHLVARYRLDVHIPRAHRTHCSDGGRDVGSGQGDHRHTPGEHRAGDLSITVKGLGDFSSSVDDLVRPGMPAVVDGPHGRFDRAHGTAEQVWIGAGVGITPFLSWARSLDERLDADRVDFYVSSRGRSPFADELHRIADAHPNLHLHVVDTAVDGHLTAERVLAELPVPPQRLSVFLCGPQRMVKQLTRAFRPAGVAKLNIHQEYFGWR